MTAPRYQPNLGAIARAALARGSIRWDRHNFGNYRFGRRAFGRDIIEAIIAAGDAIRQPNGDIIARLAAAP